MDPIYTAGGIHRDIKLANILLHYPTEEERLKDNPIIKICDFGISRLIKGDPSKPSEMSKVGTPLNMSPEIFEESAYNVKSDIWSIGSITYNLLCGRHIFVGNDYFDLFKEINAGVYKIHKSLNLSVEAIEFITSCIQRNQGTRSTWEQLKELPFVKNDTKTIFDYNVFKAKNINMKENLKACTLEKNCTFIITVEFISILSEGPTNYKCIVFVGKSVLVCVWISSISGFYVYLCVATHTALFNWLI